MKKYYGSLMLMLLGATFFTACSADEGSEPGSDSTPVATLYQYDADSETHNPDNDCFIRVVANSATKEAYYLAELAETKESRNLPEAEYANYVVANGTKLTGISGNSTQEVYITDLHGEYIVSVVAVNGSAKTIQSVDFAGLDYKPFGSGVYSPYFLWATSSVVDATKEAVDDHPVSIEYSEVGDRYRLTDVFSPGNQFSFSPSSGAVYPSSIATGCSHPKYGAVSATNGTVVQVDEKTFTFTFTWRVPAGSFGQYDDTLYIN